MTTLSRQTTNGPDPSRMKVKTMSVEVLVEKKQGNIQWKEEDGSQKYRL